MNGVSLRPRAGDRVRVVLDTNILVSACWKPEGLESQVAELAMAGTIIACVSAEVLGEYHDVLMRPKLCSVSGRAKEVLAAMDSAALLVEPTARVSASVDDDDNRFLECAATARADYLITGNLRHYPDQWGGTRIVNSRTFLALRENPNNPATVVL